MGSLTPVKIQLPDGLGTAELKYIVEDLDRHGNVRVYIKRRGHKKVRLKERPGTDEFFAEYKRGLGEQPVAPVEPAYDPAAPDVEPPKPETLRWLVIQYYRSGAYKGNAASTRDVLRRQLDALCKETFAESKDKIPHGKRSYKTLQKKHIVMMRDAKADTPDAANNRLKTIRGLFNWAVVAGHMDVSPVPKLDKMPSKNKFGHHTWTAEEMAIYTDHHAAGTMARLAHGIFEYTGVRLGDAARLGPQHVKLDKRGREWLVFYEEKQSKGAEPKLRVIPLLPELRALIDATPVPRSKKNPNVKALTFLVTSFGASFTSKGLGNKMREWCDEAKLPQCSAHGIRKHDATQAAEGGATDRQMMAIFGWTNPKQASTYVQAADKKRLAMDAMHLLADAREGRDIDFAEESGTQNLKSIDKQ